MDNMKMTEEKAPFSAAFGEPRRGSTQERQKNEAAEVRNETHSGKTLNKFQK